MNGNLGERIRARRAFVSLIVIAGLTLALASAVACGGGDDVEKPAAVATAAQPTAITVAATATTKAPDPVRKPSGTLTIAVGSVGSAASGFPRDCPQCEFIPRVGAQETLLRSYKDAGGNLVVGMLLAESWSMAADASYTDFTIRKGVQFHEGWGELTAEDVAWTYNQANTEVTPDSVHATSAEISTDVAGEVEVIDRYTVRINWKKFGVPSYHKTVTQYREGVGIFSKKVYDKEGGEWMRRNVIGTGPFVLDEWTTGKGMFLRAIEDHWRQIPDIANLEVFAVPEASTRRAMLESGQAQAADIDSKDIAGMIKDGYKQYPEGSLSSNGLIMGGNYWSKTHPDSGATLERNDFSHLAWVGDPDDAASMEQARKVRWALALTIDRETIAQQLYGGAAEPSFIGGTDVNDPLIQENIDRYRIAYDPARGRQLLQEAGYADGFQAQFYTNAAEGSITFELTQAIAAAWQQELNVDTDLAQTPYSVHRPNYINRSSQWIDYRAGGSFAPTTWQEEWYSGSGRQNADGSLGGGFNSGIQLPIADETLAIKRSTSSVEEAKAATRKYLDFMHDQMLWFGTIQVKVTGLYDPAEICGWEMDPMATAGTWGQYPERVVLCR